MQETPATNGGGSQVTSSPENPGYSAQVSCEIKGCLNMDQTFDSDGFIRRIGQRLVDEFKDAKAGTTPSTVGSAAEQPVRDQLEQILPRGIGVGEGFVIDSYGGTSRQQDVVLYERDICPVFSINNTPQTTFYPCEGVIAVGEIKSSLDGNSLQDAFQKVASVKQLQRHIVPDLMPHPTTGEPIPLRRNYLTPHRDSIVDIGEGANSKERLQIFGFVLAGDSRLKHETLVATFCTFAAQLEETLSPNLLVILDGYAIRWGNIAKQERKETHQSKDGTYGLSVYKDGPEGWQVSWSAETATHVGGSENSDAFRTLVLWIRQGAELGRTSDIRAFDRYFEAKSSGEPTSMLCVPKLKISGEDKA